MFFFPFADPYKMPDVLECIPPDQLPPRQRAADRLQRVCAGAQEPRH